jgi:putative transposase
LAHPAQVEVATLKYIDWFNHRRLYEVCGDIPPAEREDAHQRQTDSLKKAAEP